MTQYNYCILANSNGSLTKRFKVIAGGRKRTLSKSSSVDRTIGGKLDVTMGGVYEVHDYIIKVRHTEVDSNYGTLANLETLYRLVDPAATPSNVITFTDNYGSAKSAYLLGDFSDQVQGCQIEGTTAVYFVQVAIQLIP